MPKVPDLATAKAAHDRAVARLNSVQSHAIQHGETKESAREIAAAQAAVRAAADTLNDAQTNEKLRVHNEAVAAQRSQERDDAETRAAIVARQQADEWLAGRAAGKFTVAAPTHPAAQARIAEVSQRQTRPARRPPRPAPLNLERRSGLPIPIASDGKRPWGRDVTDTPPARSDSPGNTVVAPRQ